MKKLLLALTMLSLIPATHATQVFQCNIKGNVVFQSKPCPQTFKTYEQVLNISKEDLDAKKDAELRAENDYQDRLRQSAAQRGDLMVIPKHTYISVEALKPLSKVMSFSDCKKYVNDAQLSTQKPFKNSVISDTKTEYLARICRKEGSVILACSAAQNKLVITKSAHCPLK